MKRFLVATILMLAVALIGCGGYDGPETEQETMQGIQVTATVPYAHESIQDIIDRGDSSPQVDREMPNHHR